MELQKWMENWSDGKETYPDRINGSSVNVAQELWDKYGDKINPNK